MTLKFQVFCVFQFSFWWLNMNHSFAVSVEHRTYSEVNMENDGSIVQHCHGHREKFREDPFVDKVWMKYLFLFVLIVQTCALNLNESVIIGPACIWI